MLRTMFQKLGTIGVKQDFDTVAELHQKTGSNPIVRNFIGTYSTGSERGSQSHFTSKRLLRLSRTGFTP